MCSASSVNDSTVNFWLPIIVGFQNSLMKNKLLLAFLWFKVTTVFPYSSHGSLLTVIAIFPVAYLHAYCRNVQDGCANCVAGPDRNFSLRRGALNCA